MSKSKAINVKVEKKKLIDELKKAVKSREKEMADNAKSEKDYEKAHDDFINSLGEIFRSGKGQVVRATGVWNSGGKNMYELTVLFPANLKAPTRDNVSRRAEWQIKAELDEITNAIKLLEMCTDEILGTSTYAGIARYI